MNETTKTKSNNMMITKIVIVCIHRSLFSFVRCIFRPCRPVDLSTRTFLLKRNHKKLKLKIRLSLLKREGKKYIYLF